MAEQAETTIHHNQKLILNMEIESKNNMGSSKHPYHVLASSSPIGSSGDKGQKTDRLNLRCHNLVLHSASSFSQTNEQKDLCSQLCHGKQAIYKQHIEKGFNAGSSPEIVDESDMTKIRGLPTGKKSGNREIMGANIEVSSGLSVGTKEVVMSSPMEELTEEDNVDGCESIPKAAKEVSGDENKPDIVKTKRTGIKRRRTRISFPNRTIRNIIRNLSCHSVGKETKTVVEQECIVEQKSPKNEYDGGFIRTDEVNDEESGGGDSESSNRQSIGTVITLPELEFEVYDNDQLLDVDDVFDDILSHVESLSLRNPKPSYHSPRAEIPDTSSIVARHSFDDSAKMTKMDRCSSLSTNKKFQKNLGNGISSLGLSANEVLLRDFLKPKAELTAPLRSVKRPRLDDNKSAVKFYRMRS